LALDRGEWQAAGLLHDAWEKNRGISWLRSLVANRISAADGSWSPIVRSSSSEPSH